MTDEQEIISSMTSDQSEDKANWKIRDKSHANWAMRELVSLQKQRGENLDLFESENTRLINWLVEVNEPLEEKIRFRQEQLTAFMREQREGDPKVKSILLPFGKLKSRIAGSGTIVVEDDEAFIKFCEDNEHEDWVKIDKRVNRSNLTKAVIAHIPEDAEELPATVEAFDENGQRIPGVSVSTGTLSISVEADLS